MKALVVTAPGAIALRDVPEPPVPAGECRIDVRRAGICRTDLELVRGYMGFAGIPGHEFVGTVRTGPAHLIGRRVVGEINCPIDPGQYSLPDYDPRHEPHRTVLGILGRPGAFAESLCLPPQNLLVVPDAVSDEQAVFTEPLAAALAIFETHPIPPGTRILVIGDGKLGLLVAQACAQLGHRVALRGHHERKLALARRWGVETPNSAEGYPFVVEATGAPDGFRAALAAVQPRGTVILKSTYAPTELPALDAAKIVVDEITLAGSRCGRFAPALRLLAENKIDVRGLIDARLPLARGVEAFAQAGQRGALKVLVGVGGRE